jgi:hypothetical protein
MALTFRKAVIGLAAAGALTVGGVAGVAPASAQGPGTALCFPVPAAAHVDPAGGPGYGFDRNPPAAVQAFAKCF